MWSLLAANLRTTMIPLLVFVTVAIAVPVYSLFHDYRRGKPLRLRTVLGYTGLGVIMGAAFAGALVAPPEVRQHFPPRPPGIR